MCIIDYFKLFSCSCAINQLSKEFEFASITLSFNNLIVAKMIEELEIAYMSFCASCTVIMELDKKKK